MIKTINSKLQDMLATIAIIFSFIIIIIMLFYYFFIASIQSKKESLGMIEQNKILIQMTLDTLYTSFLYDFGTEEFREELWAMANNLVPQEHTRYSIQNELVSFREHNTILSSAGIYDKRNRKLYTLYKEPVLSTNEHILSEEDMKKINGITWLCNRKTPFLNSEDVSYLVVPLKAGTFTSIAPSEEETDAYLIAFINNEALSTMLEFKEGNDYHSFFLYTTKGDCIIGVGNDKNNANTQKAISFYLLNPSFKNSRYSINLSEIENKNIYAIDCIDYIEVFRNISASFIIILITAISIIILVMSSSKKFMKKNISDPISELEEGVKHIKEGDYTYDVKVNSDDELGSLADSFNNMSTQIVSQMEEIREKEELAYQAELRLLTEQLNPHLIYNTLEYIRQGITTSSTDKADQMIKHLSTYLRTALVGGRYLVTVQNEIKHIISYVNIMSGRFNQPITLSINAFGTEDSLIIKSLLQPIVENAIKHGFSIDKTTPVMINPSIEINIKKKNDKLIVSISDNGLGFDEAKIISIMEDTKRTDHVGLTNTYKRIVTFYGKENIEINLSSIPFYKNTFTFILPYLVENE